MINSHFVTRSLLRRFTKDNQLLVHDVLSKKEYLKEPERISYIKFPDEIILPYESDWNNIESKMSKIYPLIDNGTMLQSTQNISTVIKFMALHFTRSFHLLALMKKYEKAYFDQAIDEAKNNNPEKREMIEMNRPIERNNWLMRLNYKSLPEFLGGNLPKVEEFMLGYEIEIGLVLGKFELVLSDGPVINISEEKKQSIIEGVRLGNSTNISMPLGPRHFVALKSANAKKEYIPLNDQAVKNINSFSVRQSIRYFYSNPASRKYRVGY